MNHFLFILDLTSFVRLLVHRLVKLVYHVVGNFCFSIECSTILVFSQHKNTEVIIF